MIVSKRCIAVYPHWYLGISSTHKCSKKDHIHATSPLLRETCQKLGYE